jgi:hypothetical protein
MVIAGRLVFRLSGEPPDGFGAGRWMTVPVPRRWRESLPALI